jgi:putative ABC transport system ATP-binding protein
MTTLRVRNLSKTYGSGESAVHAVRNAAFEVSAGEFVALVGPSGSGKTTLLAMLGGLLTPTEGVIEVDGRDIARLSGSERATYRRESVGFVFQANNLLPYLTARQNLMVLKAIGGRRLGKASERADQLLAELGLERRSAALATELSGGERQRVAIARALMNDPRLVLVDEPTASLDSERGKQVVQSLMGEVKVRGKLGIMVTHDTAMAELADRVLQIHDGELREAPNGAARASAPALQ